MHINTDVHSLTTMNNLYRMDRRIGTVLSRLSTGLRINSAKDDPSGMGVKTQIESAGKAAAAAMINANDTLSMLQTIDSGLRSVEDITVRILDLARMASDPNMCCEDRTILHTEATELVSEIDRLALGVEYNDKNVLFGNILDNIVRTAGTEQDISSYSPASKPMWSSTNTVSYTGQVGIAGSRRSNNPGDTSFRVFNQTIDTGTNAPIGGATQLTDDPLTLGDGDGDGFYDTLAGGYNDPQPADASFPDNADFDGDGWGAFVDNNNWDNSETGTGLNTLNPDYVFGIGAPAYTRDETEITLQNTVYRAFGPTEVDEVDVRVTAGMNYSVEVFDTTGPGWTQIGTGTGNGAWQTISPGGDILANEVRVILDEPLNDATGNVEIGNVTDEIQNTLPLGAATPQTPPKTHHFSVNAGPQAINQIEVDTSAGNYDVYYRDGGGNIQLLQAGLSGYNLLSFADINANDIYIEMDNAGANVTTFNADYVSSYTYNFAGILGGNTYQYDAPGFPAATNITHITTDVNPAGAVYDVYYTSTPPAPPAADIAGAVGDQDFDLGGTFAVDSIYLDMAPGDTVNGVTAREEAAVAITDNGVLGSHVVRYDITGGPMDLTDLSIAVTAGVEYTVTDNLGTPISGGAQTGTGLTQNYTGFGTPNASYIEVTMEYEDTAADILSIGATNITSLGAPVLGVGDTVPPVDNNVVTYNLVNGGTLVDNEFDTFNYTVAAGEDFSIHVFDGGWNPAAIVSGTGTGVATDFYVGADANEIDATQIRIVLHSGNTANGNASINSVTNRIDRDGDGFPDVIEALQGSDRDDALDLPFGAVGGPDDDNDGYLDYTARYDTYEVDFAASTNPMGYTWVNGRGNSLDSAGPGAQYGPAGTVSAASIPSTADADGDRFNDPWDPFPNDADWTTWVDGDSAYRGGDVLFVSNRATPNTGMQDIYRLSGGVYSRLTTSGTAADPTISWDGTAYAWEDGGDIYGTSTTTDCSGTTTGVSLISNNGANPSFNQDNTLIAFERAGSIIVADTSTGAETNYGISGTNPDWSPSGNMIAYTRGGTIYAYDIASSTEFNLGIAGDNAAWSPDENKIAYESGGDIYVVSLTIDRTPETIRIATNSDSSLDLSYDLPDVRTFALGLNTVNLLNQAAAQSTATSAEAALEVIMGYRSDAGAMMRRVQSINSDLAATEFAAIQTKSYLADANMPEEITNLVASMLAQQGAVGVLGEWVSYERIKTLIDSTYNDN